MTGIPTVTAPKEGTVQNWIIENKEWLFSGLGIAIFSVMFAAFQHIKKLSSQRKNSYQIGHTDKMAYKLSKVISLQTVFIAALSKEENIEPSLYKMIGEGFKHLMNLSFKCSVPERIIKLLSDSENCTNSDEIISLFSQYVVATNSYFELEAVGGMGLSYYSGLIVQHAKDGEKSLDIIHDHVKSALKACSRINSVALPKQVRNIFNRKTSRLLEKEECIPREITTFINWAESSYA